MFSDIVFTRSFINDCHFEGYLEKTDIWKRWRLSLENEKNGLNIEDISVEEVSA